MDSGNELAFLKYSNVNEFYEINSSLAYPTNLRVYTVHEGKKYFRKWTLLNKTGAAASIKAFCESELRENRYGVKWRVYASDLSTTSSNSSSYSGYIERMSLDTLS